MVKTTATEQQKQQAQRIFESWWEEFQVLNDEALACCDVLLAFCGAGIGTGIREWMKRCETTHGREHNPWEDAQLTTVIEEAQAISRLARVASPLMAQPPVGSNAVAMGNPGVDDLVNLDEAAALVHRSKRTLERHLRRMPAPYVQGGGGKPSLWKWDELRPWLETEYVPDLPKRFPRNVR